MNGYRPGYDDPVPWDGSGCYPDGSVGPFIRAGAAEETQVAVAATGLLSGWEPSTGMPLSTGPEVRRGRRVERGYLDLTEAA